MRKTCRAMRDLLGLDLSPDDLSQALARIAKRLAPDHAALLRDVKAQPALYTDGTSWFVGAPGHSLWVLANDAGTYYRVVPSRSKDAAQALIGADYAGVLVSDCLNIYDDLTARQHKCYAHHLKAIAQALEKPSARGSPYLTDLRGLLHGAMALKDMSDDLSPEAARAMRRALDDNADRLLSEPRAAAPLAEAAAHDQAAIEEKLRQRLAKQRDHLFTFLDCDGADATNNLAERQLRPAVISRKLSCGNKTEAGGQTWEILASAAATCQQKRISFIDQLVAKIPLALADAPAC